MSRPRRWLAILACSAVCIAGSAVAAEIRVNNLDAGTGKGLDDPTPATPIGGNPGKTRGEQARIVFQYAASLWGAVLKSRVPIEIDAAFQKLACTANAATLGSAGSIGIYLVDKGAPGSYPGVAYHAALASALEGVDVAPGRADILARFNSSLGTPGCLEKGGWYLGLDGNTPASQNNFLNVILHEMSHGLGFSGFGNVATGRPLTDNNGAPIPDIYSLNVYDNTKRQWWYDMSDAERASSVLNDGHLVYAGSNVRTHAPLALGPRDALLITAPATGAREYGFARAPFGPKISPANFHGTVVRAVSGDNAEACAALDNAGAVNGHIVLVDRGGCNYAAKARFAQAAGATGVIVADKPGDSVPVLPPAGEAGTAIDIPLIQITRNDGDALKANLVGLQAELRALLHGADMYGNVRLYAPSVLRVGSSFSHFDVSLSPNALMEWAESPDLRGHINLDLTPSLFMDEGWRVNAGGQLLGLCDTGVPSWIPGGFIVGANIAATAKLLAGSSPTVGDYATAMRAHATKLANGKWLSASQATSLNACLSDAEITRQYAGWRQGGSGNPVFTELDGGKVLPAQAGAAGSERLYLLTVPPGARALNIRTFGGTGDVSLYVKVGNEPGPASYSYRSVHAGNSEAVVVARPVAGSYFIKLVGAMPYADMSLQATYSM